MGCVEFNHELDVVFPPRILSIEQNSSCRCIFQTKEIHSVTDIYNFYEVSIVYIHFNSKNVRIGKTRPAFSMTELKLNDEVIPNSIKQILGHFQ